MGEGGTAFDVSNGVDAGDAGLEVFVDLDVAVGVDVDSSGGQVEGGGVGRASGGNEEMRAGDGARL